MIYLLPLDQHDSLYHDCYRSYCHCLCLLFVCVTTPWLLRFVTDSYFKFLLLKPVNCCHFCCHQSLLLRLTPLVGAIMRLIVALLFIMWLLCRDCCRFVTASCLAVFVTASECCCYCHRRLLLLFLSSPIDCCFCIATTWLLPLFLHQLLLLLLSPLVNLWSHWLMPIGFLMLLQSLCHDHCRFLPLPYWCFRYRRLILATFCSFAAAG